METTYWHKQGSEPLFPELEWNKPERRDQAGRLLILGGNAHALTAPAQAYEITRKQGVGVVKIILPEKTKRLVGHTLPDAVFLPSTNHGEFSQEGITECISLTNWADTLLLAGDIGRNSQTSIFLEEVVRQTTIPTIVAKDAIEALGNHPKLLLERENTIIVASFSQLQRLLKESETVPLQFSMSFVQLVAYIHELTKRYNAAIATIFEEQIIIAKNGQISTTKLKNNENEPPPWRLQYASLAACYHTWNPKEPFKALTYVATLLQ